MIDVKDLTVAYGGETVLENCSLHVARGERAALMGPSGCGKTTLLNVIVGLIKPRSGSVSAEGRVSYVFQEPRLFEWLTALQNVNVVLSDGAETRDEAARWLRTAGLAEAADKYPSELSGGMRQRLSICRALAAGGDILLLDEPLKGMDRALRDEIAGVLRRESEGRTVLLVTHDEDEARALADTVYQYADKKFTRR